MLARNNNTFSKLSISYQPKGGLRIKEKNILHVQVCATTKRRKKRRKRTFSTFRLLRDSMNDEKFLARAYKIFFLFFPILSIHHYDKSFIVIICIHNIQGIYIADKIYAYVCMYAFVNSLLMSNNTYMFFYSIPIGWIYMRIQSDMYNNIVHMCPFENFCSLLLIKLYSAQGDALSST